MELALWDEPNAAYRKTFLSKVSQHQVRPTSQRYRLEGQTLLFETQRQPKGSVEGKWAGNCSKGAQSQFEGKKDGGTRDRPPEFAQK